MKKKWLAAVLAGALLAAALLSGCSSVETVKRLRFGVAGEGGIYREFGERFAVDAGCGSEHSHLLSVASVCAGIDNAVGRDVEIFCKLIAQTRAVESCESCDARGFHAGVEKSDQTRYVGGVEDNHDMFHIGAIFSYVLSEVFGNLSIAFEMILAGHACLTGCTTR